MTMPKNRFCPPRLWLFGVGLLALNGCAEVPPVPSGPTAAQRALLGMTKQSVISCAGRPGIERTRDEEMLFVYYREAPQFEESFGGTKSSFPMVRHGCRATIMFRQDRVADVQYQSEPSTYRDEDHCEEIFEACVSR